VHEYDVWLPHARRVTVERLGGGPQILSVAETGLAEDSYSYTEQYPVAAGYSAAGEAPPLVYANYGRVADFENLRRTGSTSRARSR
jgi:hypothetical protein